jgi:hypothetical protein
MSQDLNELTTADLKQYLSQHRNEPGVFHDCLQILMQRSEGAERHPYPFDLPNQEATVAAILQAKIDQMNS